MSDVHPTGERTLPGIQSENYWFQRHVVAYRLARRHARGRVVDAGCGEGYGTRVLAQRGIRVAGIDLEEEVVVRAAGHYPGAAFLVADLCRPPLRERSVDTVVALQVLEHLASPEEFLAGAAAALRPGGTLILSTPNRATFPTGRNPWHVHEYEAGELEWLLMRHFDRVTLLGTAHGPGLRLVERFAGPLQERLISRPFEEQPRWLRWAMARVRPRHFGLTHDAAAGLDLVAICRRYDRGVANPRDVSTVHLGQFTHATANAIAEELDEAGIVWWFKEPGFFSQIWEIGIRLFVDRERLDEAKAIAERLSRG